jgi:hypothetical protein
MPPMPIKWAFSLELLVFREGIFNNQNTNTYCLKPKTQFKSGPVCNPAGTAPGPAFLAQAADLTGGLGE